MKLSLLIEESRQIGYENPNEILDNLLPLILFWRYTDSQ